jgi:hypothetical protein
MHMIALTTSGNSAARAAPLAGRSDLKRVLHDLEDSTALEILALSPTVADVEEAALRIAGVGDVLNRTGHTFTSKISRIVAILEREDEPDR